MTSGVFVIVEAYKEGERFITAESLAVIIEGIRNLKQVPLFLKQLSTHHEEETDGDIVEGTVLNFALFRYL